MNRPRKRVMVIGLDSAPPELVFGRWLDQLPVFKRLASNGIYGELESTIPSITCPAWATMVTGRDPGRLGVYGFRNRTRYDYSEMSFVDSSWIKDESVWDVLARYGKRSILLGIPPTYPPRPVNGLMVSCFLAGDTSAAYTYPKNFKQEVEAASGGYIMDVKDFRTGEKGQVLNSIYRMTANRFRLAGTLIQKKNWDFFMMVEMGTDRIQHAFWRFFDQEHPRYCPGTEFSDAILGYYRYLDRKIGEILNLVGDDTTVMLVSDHGAKRFEGGVCVNEWLIRNGYLRLKEYPQRPTPFRELKVDWQRTAAWAESGFYGRVFMNVQGREPLGTIPAHDYQRVRNEIAHGLEEIVGPHGRRLDTSAFRPQDIYPEVRGIAPDLLVYFDDQRCRSIGSVGHNSLWTDENDNGSDDANHSQHGIFIMHDPAGPHAPGKRDGLNIKDIAPTILAELDVPPPDGLEGRQISQNGV
ncbi:MAG: alkaline phosphatase family protein [Planctomycetota bacterium]